MTRGSWGKWQCGHITSKSHVARYPLPQHGKTVTGDTRRTADDPARFTPRHRAKTKLDTTCTGGNRGCRRTETIAGLELHVGRSGGGSKRERERERERKRERERETSHTSWIDCRARERERERV